VKIEAVIPAAAVIAATEAIAATAVIVATAVIAAARVTIEAEAAEVGTPRIPVVDTADRGRISARRCAGSARRD